MDYNALFKKIILSNKYLTERELKYDTKYGVFLSDSQYKEYLDYKDNIVENKFLINLPLKSYNSKKIYFVINKESINIAEKLTSLIEYELNSTGTSTIIKNMPEILQSRIFSEIEGSLNIEEVPTTRRRVKELLSEERKAENKNDVIIKNMGKAIEYVNTVPEFTKENLFKLYTILSNDCLENEDLLREGEYYRYDVVYVDNYEGCPVEEIDSCMNSLFEFVNGNITDKYTKQLLPHIVHYYLLYIHPYFDYNGRTARMVSYWISLLKKKMSLVPFISDAINQTKNKYYNSISESRNSHNDITYFINYILKTSADYVLCYQNIDNIKVELQNKAIIPTDLEFNYMKKIIISSKGYFTYGDFINWIKIDMSKQGAFKILNKLVSYGFLNEVDTKTSKKLFVINEKVIRYKNNTEK